MTRIPMSQLRFVERHADGRKVRILQQLIGFANGAMPQWEDVPVYAEEVPARPLPTIEPHLLEVGK